MLAQEDRTATTRRVRRVAVVIPAIRVSAKLV